MSSKTGFLWVSLILVAVLYAMSLSLPFSDDSSVNQHENEETNSDWIRSDDQPTEYSSLFYPVRILLYRLLDGSTRWVVMLFSAVATFLSIQGMYKLGRNLSCELAGWLSAFALFVTPLFIIHAMRPMQDTAVVAAVIWSLYLYTRKNYLWATILCVLATVFGDQAVLLASAYLLAELFQTGVRKPRRLLLFLSPVLIFVATGFFNLSENGHFFFWAYAIENSGLEGNWLIDRAGSLGSHLIAGDFRWFPITVALAGMIRGTGRDRDRRSLPFILILTLPALLFPPDRIAFLVFVTTILAVYLIQNRLVLGRLTTVFIVLPVSSVLFHVFISPVGQYPTLFDLRCMMPVYPLIILGSIIMLFKYFSRRTAFIIGLISVVSTAAANR